MGQEKENQLKRKADVPMEVVMADDDEVEDEGEEEEADRRFVGFLYGIDNLEARDPRFEALTRQAGEMLTRLEQGVLNLRLDIEILNNVARNQRAATNVEVAVNEGEDQQDKNRDPNGDQENGGQVGGEDGIENGDDENDFMDD